MGGSSGDYERVRSSPSSEVRNVVLVGRTGDGKSATANSIIGESKFTSKRSSSSVTTTCELKTNILRDGQILNVIDTPGLFDFSPDTESISKEIIKCIEMANEGIHAVLLVYSVKTRFSREEEAVFHCLRSLFGEKVIDYMIVVFTGGDELEADQTLDDYLGCDCPEPLLKILHMCGNRKVLFDNKTRGEAIRAKQLQELLSLMNSVLHQNGGKPFTDEISVELKGAMKTHFQAGESSSEWMMQKLYNEQLERITLMIEVKLKEVTLQLQKQLEEEHAARMKLEEKCRVDQEKSNKEIWKLRDDLKKAQSEANEIRKKAEKCNIL